MVEPLSLNFSVYSNVNLCLNITVLQIQVNH